MTDIAIRCRDLCRSFGTLRAVDRLNLTVDKGTIYGFLGPNGSGKSTAMRLLCGLLLPTSGDIEVLGYVIPRQAEQLRHHIGYMPQKNALYGDLTVEENLRFMAGVYLMDRRLARQRIDELLSRYDLDHFRRSRVDYLSGGLRQKAALAVATLHRPPLLILDEPTSEVDPQSRREFWSGLFELVEEGATALVSTHFMDEAERCHRLAVFHRGRKMVDGSPEELMRQVAAHVLRVDAPVVAAVSRLLLGHDRVISVAQIGQHLRVMVEPAVEDPIASVQDALASAGLTGTVTTQSANLEDVFVAATRKEAPA